MQGQGQGECQGEGQGEVEDARAKSRSLPSSARHGLGDVSMDTRGPLTRHRCSLVEDPGMDSKKRPLSISSVSSASSSSLSRPQCKRPNLDHSPLPAIHSSTSPSHPEPTDTPRRAAGMEYRSQQPPGGGQDQGEGGQGTPGTPSPASPLDCVQCSSSSDGSVRSRESLLALSKDVNHNLSLTPDQTRTPPQVSPGLPSPSGQGGSLPPTPSPVSITTTSPSPSLTRSPGSRSRSGNARPASVSSPESGSKYVSYVERVVSEIVETEAKYVRSLEDIISGYLEFLESTLPPDMTSDLSTLFSNIRDIYKFSKSFLQELEVCGGDPVQVAECFVRSNQGFVIYTDYCTNYPSAVEVLTRFMKDSHLSEVFRNRQLVLGHGLPLGAYLLRPVQRILKYHLMLQNILKNFDKRQPGHVSLEQALKHMTSMADYINEMKRKHEHAVRIQEIQSQLDDYGGEDLTRLGELVLEGTFRVYGARASRHVFLFEKGLLICKKKDGAMLSCKALIPVSNLMLVEVIPNEPLSFNIIPFDNPRNQYTLQARNTEQKRRWCQEVKRLILESYSGKIPDKVKCLVMELGRGREEDVLGYEGPKKHQKAPEYLERRRVRRKSGGRLPDLLKPQRAQKKANKKAEATSPRVSPQPARRALRLEDADPASAEFKSPALETVLPGEGQTGGVEVPRSATHGDLAQPLASPGPRRDEEPMELEGGESRATAGAANDVRRAMSFRKATRLHPLSSDDLSHLPLSSDDLSHLPLKVAPAPADAGIDSDGDDPDLMKDGLREYTDYLFDSRSDLDVDSDQEEGVEVKAWRNSRSSSQGSLAGLGPPVTSRPRSATENGAGSVKTPDRQVNNWLNRQEDSRFKAPGSERKVAAFHDTYASRRAAHKMKLQSMNTQMSSAAKHLSLPNELRKGPTSGAKLTNWSSVDKLTKGSLTDVSHLEEDPWVLNTELVNKTASASSLSSGGSAGSRPRAGSEVRESSHANQENLDWMVYVNRNAQDPRLQGRHTLKPQVQGKEVSLRPVPSRGSLGGHVESVYDPLPGDPALPPAAAISGPAINSTPPHLQGRARSQSSAAQLSSSTLPHHPQHWHHMSQAARASPHWRHSLESPPHPTVHRRRTASVDNPGSVDIIQESVRMVAEMEDYMKNSPTSPTNHARFPTSLSPPLLSQQSPIANRLSSGSSISTSSYDSGSSDGQPDLPQSSSGDDVDTPSMDSSEVSSRRDRSRSGSYDVMVPSTPPTPQASVSEDSHSISPTGSVTPTQMTSPSLEPSSPFSPCKDAFHASSPNLSPRLGGTRDPQSRNTFKSEPGRSVSMAKLSPRTDVLPSHSPLVSPMARTAEREKRELQHVLRSRELGSSAIGSRIAHSEPTPPPIASPPLSPPSDSSPLSRPRSACVEGKANPAQQSAYDFLAKEASPDSPVRFSLPLPAQAAKALSPDLPSSLQQSDSGFSMQSDVTDSVGEEALQAASPGASPREEESGSAEGATAPRGRKKRRDSNSSAGSMDSIYERRFSEALEPGMFRDSAVFCDPDTGSKSPSVCDEPVPRRSIREFVQVLEERSKQRLPRPLEVKRRPPGRIIQQRLQTLAQVSQYRSHREGSLTRLPSEERELPSRSVRDIQATLVPSASEQASAVVPIANQFVHRRSRIASVQPSSGSPLTHSSSPLTRSSSNVGSRPNSVCGSLRAAKSLGRLDQLGTETEGAVIMKGWVQQLISRFQTDSASSKESSPSPSAATSTTATTSTASVELAH